MCKLLSKKDKNAKWDKKCRNAKVVLSRDVIFHENQKENSVVIFDLEPVEQVGDVEVAESNPYPEEAQGYDDTSSENEAFYRISTRSAIRELPPSGVITRSKSGMQPVNFIINFAVFVEPKMV